MNVGIIGAGFTGLAAARELLKKGNKVTLFEKDSNPGGLALGFKEKKWEWTLEHHYHHWFTNDQSILDLAREMGYEVIIKSPKTSIYVGNSIYRLDSPTQVLKFPLLTLFERLRMGFGLALLRFNPFWKPLEKFRAVDILPKLLGKKAYEMIWEPLLDGKFGKYKYDVSLAWFWGRISKRTENLAYPKGGFQAFANAIADIIKKNGGNFVFNAEVIRLNEKNKRVEVTWKDSSGTHSQIFDKVVVTLPGSLFVKIAPSLTADYKNKLLALKELGAINLILRLKKPFFKDNTYWLNICDTKYSLTGIVEHTNYMDKKYYNNEHLVYLLNYLPQNHPFMSMNKDQLLKMYNPILAKINKTYKSNIIDTHLFSSLYAQPVMPINYSKLMPSFVTPMKNVYLSNIQQVYPWDRGTTYAVKLGKEIAKIISKNSLS